MGELMRAMILAAGRGARMGALTENTPKPLLRVRDRYLIEYSIGALQKIGITEIVINVSYLAEQIKSALGDGKRYGVDIYYSEEKEPLETGGGVFQALPLLGDDPFIILSSDVITDFPLNTLPKEPKSLAHLVVVDNPHYHPTGDFCLENEKIFCCTGKTFTFSNIGVYRKELFANCQPGHFRLGNLLKQYAADDKITGEHYRGVWHNLGTPDDLIALRDILI